MNKENSKKKKIKKKKNKECELVISNKNKIIINHTTLFYLYLIYTT